MLCYTGHPLIDVGVATITAFAGKTDPTQLTQTDLDQVAEYIARNYTRPPLQGYLHGAVFPNSGYTNPGIKGDRTPYFSDILYAYRNDPEECVEQCALCGNPSSQRVARDYFPLLMGRGGINFYPWGDSGLPICGKCLLSIQAYPLGSGGLMLVVHSDCDKITFHFAREFLTSNRKALLLAQSEGDKKYLRAGMSYRTLLIQTLMEAERRQVDDSEDKDYYSITAYSISNSGQSPSLSIFHLPIQITAFLRAMQRAENRTTWQAIVNRAWQKPKSQKGEQDFQPRYNTLYEDLFRLPENARQFIRAYFLRIPSRYGLDKQDPRLEYSPRTEAQYVSWDVTAQFLERVLKMEQGRINEIREMGDRLADYVYEQNDKRFFRNFFTARYPTQLSSILIKANIENLKRNVAPVVKFDSYITVFEEGEGVPRVDWRLARDLVLIRMIEQLYAKGWLSQNTDGLPDEFEEQEEG